MAGVPDWIPPVQAAGVKVDIIPTEEFFPHMAQGIATSDEMIKKNPETDPEIRHRRAARHEGHHGRSGRRRRRLRQIRAGLEGQGRRDQVRLSITTPRCVYPGQKKLGEVNGERLAKLQDFYLAKGFITKKVPVRRPLHQSVHQVRSQR